MLLCSNIKEPIGHATRLVLKARSRSRKEASEIGQAMETVVRTRGALISVSNIYRQSIERYSQ